MTTAFEREHDLHRRRFGRNMGVLAVLLAFVALVFGLTIVKIGNGDSMEGFDHRSPTNSAPHLIRTEGLPLPKGAAPDQTSTNAQTPEAQQ